MTRAKDTVSDVKDAPTIWLFSDMLAGQGGIETYMDALARRLHAEGLPIRIAVSLNGETPIMDELEASGIDVYRQPAVPGDRWQIRQRLLIRHVARHLRPGDWVYCVRQPMPELYLSLVKAVHARGAKIAASWMLAPEFLPPPPGQLGERFKRAIMETDVVISVSECTRHQFRDVYDYDGPVRIVRYHNRPMFSEPVPLPPGPPYAIGFIGRISIDHKNLDTILDAFKMLRARRSDVVLNFYGGGQDFALFQSMIAESGLQDCAILHGPYDHRYDLPDIMAANHVFVYTSRFEGGPCFSILELLQAGRFVVTSPVGGIPDVYDGRPEIGNLAPSGSAALIAQALDSALLRISAGKVDPAAIRSVYEGEFDDAVAHRQWLRALGLLPEHQEGDAAPAVPASR